MGPAGHLDQARRRGPRIGDIQLLEAGIGVGMQEAPAGTKQRLSVLALAIG